MQQLRAKQLKVVLVIALLTTYVFGENEFERKMQDLRNEMKAFQNTTIAELNERVAELEAEVVVLQESQVLQTENIHAVREDIDVVEGEMDVVRAEIDDVAAETELLDERTDNLEIRDVQQEYEINTLSNTMTTVEDIVNVLDERTDSLEIRDVQQEYEINTLSSRMTTVEDIVNAPLVSCQSDPCTNGATCIDVTADKFICSCHPGHYGTQCENSLRNASFLASFSFDSANLDMGVIIFDEVVTNPGNHYNAITGYYTVPQSGTYEIYYQLTVAEIIADSYIAIDDILYTYTYEGGGTTSYYNAAATYITTHLNEGQVVHVENDCSGCNTDGTAGGAMSGWFGINLLYAD